MTTRLTFDELPDVAWVKLPVVSQISAKCTASVYAYAKSGRMPPIEKIDSGGVSSGMRVGKFRRYLQDPTNYNADNDKWPL